MKSITVGYKARRRKLPSYKPLKLSKRIKPRDMKKLPTVRSLLKQSTGHIWSYKRVFMGVLVVYVLLCIVMVKGFASTIDVPNLKDELGSQLGTNALTQNLALVGVVAASGGASNEAGDVYQSVLLVIIVLAFIWLFRHTEGKKNIKLQIRQPFYEGMTQVIPFLLVLLVIGIQLMPMLAGLSIFGIVQNNGLAATGLETFLWAVLTTLLSLLTLYFLSSSLFALLIVTLPGTRPIAALKSARKVVAFRRMHLMAKLFGVILVCLSIVVVILLGIVAAAPSFAEYAFLIFGSAIIPVFIGAWYKMYRALL